MKALLIGGHLSPALAVIDALPIGTEIFFVGRKHSFEGDKAISLEYKTITEKKIPFFELTTGRIQRKITRYTLSSLFKLPVGFTQSLSLLQKIQPDVIVGFGGYLQVPVCIVGALLRIPIVIHEQTLAAGLANKMIGKIASKVCISFPTSQMYFAKKKTILTGNPIRESIKKVANKPKKKNVRPTLYITGGSTGAHGINRLVGKIIEKLVEKYTVIHQTGDSQVYGDFAILEEKKKSLPPSLQERYTLIKFVSPDEVGEYMHTADLVLSRSGMNTITELLFLQKPSLLIPLPQGQKREQLHNAEFLKEQGLSVICEQSLTSAENLYTQITQMFDRIDRYTVSDKKLAQISESAAASIVSVIQNVSQKKSSTTKN